jgi:hypothetical protein
MINPRPLTQRERDLIELYSHCQLGMTPKTVLCQMAGHL